MSAANHLPEVGQCTIPVQEPRVLGRGYYVDTVGKNTKKIAEYIQNQLKEDAAADQLTIEDIDPFTGSK